MTYQRHPGAVPPHLGARLARLTLLLLAIAVWPGAVLEALCQSGPETLCLLDGRFRVEVDWRNQHGGGVEGRGRALPESDLTGTFWFFDPAKVELVVKALDGSGINGRFWFFYGALSDVEYWIHVTDTASGARTTYHNPPGNLCGRGDTSAFPAGRSPPGAAPLGLLPLRGVQLPLRAPDAGPRAGSCTGGGDELCLLGGRFRVKVSWRNQHAGGTTGAGTAVPRTDESGLFWFFDRQNLELAVKVLDGRAVNDRFWVFYGALSEVEYWIEVEDTATGARRIYHNPPGYLCGQGDTAAFCERPVDCGSTSGRPLFGSTPVQLDLDDTVTLVFGDFDLASDVDVVSLHQDFYGIPWEAFAAGKAPPRPWANRMEEIRAWAQAEQRPVYLSLELVGGNGRAHLAKRAVVSGGELRVEDGWSPPCINLDTHPQGEKWKRAFLSYVRYMVDTFRPRYLTPAIEINLFQRACDEQDPGAYDALVALHNQAYDLARSIDPGLAIFPSLQIDWIIDRVEGGACREGDPLPCIRRNLERNRGLKRDRFAISLYPHLLELGGLEIDYREYIDSVLREVAPEPAVIAETGYLSTPFFLHPPPGSPSQQCTVVFEFNDQRQRRYFDALVQTASEADMELVVWWSNRDLMGHAATVTCPCRDREGFCELLDQIRQALGLEGEILFRAFSSMGVRRYDGTPKPLLERWQEVRSLP